jgi:hypothetical protein
MKITIKYKGKKIKIGISEPIIKISIGNHMVDIENERESCYLNYDDFNEIIIEDN